MGESVQKMKIGKNVFIHPTAYIGECVEIHDNVYIGAGCVIGSFAEHPHVKTKEHGRVIIGSNTTLTKLVTIDCPLEEDSMTIIGDNCYLMSGAHCGHDAVLQHNVTLSCGAKIGGYAHIGSHSTVGLNASVHQWSIVKEGTMIGANCFFKGEGEPFTIYVGVPHKSIGANWRLQKKLGLI